MLYAKTAEEIPGPARIVFDLFEVEPVFRCKTNFMRDYESSLTEVMEMLPAYINEAHTAEDGLKAYVERVIEDHSESGADQDGRIYAGAIQLVGKHMLEQYVSLGLFHHNGWCHYVFDGWLDPHSPVFKKVTVEELFYA